MVDRLHPADQRVQHREVNLRGKLYHYLIGEPQDTPVDTVFLIHGFPDFSFGWRFQIPMLLSMKLRVVAPDMLGYGRTDAPDNIAHYTLKNLSDDLAALVNHVCGEDSRIILGGHDWGAALVWRFGLWHPNRVKGIFAVCVPFWPPQKQYMDLENVIAAGKLGHFRYQLQFVGPDLEREIQGDERIRQFLNAMFGGRNNQGNFGFSPEQGVLLDKLPDLGPTPLLTPEELDYYVAEFSRHGLRGPLNWYRTRKQTSDEEQQLLRRGPDAIRLKVPSLFIAASRDAALPPSMAVGSDRFCDDLTTAEVNASHWALWQAPAEVNKTIREWIGTRFLKGAMRASL